MFGSRLQISSLMGLQPVVGGRFYGMGNVTFALFATVRPAALHRRLEPLRPTRAARARPPSAALAIGLAAVVVDGCPGWGADGGGPPALLPGLAYLVLAILGIRMTWRRGAVIAGGDGRAVPARGLPRLAAGRRSRSPTSAGSSSRSSTAARGDIIIRKLEQNLDILFGNYRLTLLVPIALVFVIYILARPTSWGSRSLQRSYEACPTLRPGLIALLITLTIGFAINDSGVAIPANGAIIAVPAHHRGERQGAGGRGSGGRATTRALAARVSHPHTSSTAYGTDGAAHPEGDAFDGRASSPDHPAGHVGDGHRGESQQQDQVEHARPPAPAASPR